MKRKVLSWFVFFVVFMCGCSSKMSIWYKQNVFDIRRTWYYHEIYINPTNMEKVKAVNVYYRSFDAYRFPYFYSSFTIEVPARIQILAPNEYLHFDFVPIYQNDIERHKHDGLENNIFRYGATSTHGVRKLSDIRVDVIDSFDCVSKETIDYSSFLVEGRQLFPHTKILESRFVDEISSVNGKAKPKPNCNYIEIKKINLEQVQKD